MKNYLGFSLFILLFCSCSFHHSLVNRPEEKLYLAQCSEVKPEKAIQKEIAVFSATDSSKFLHRIKNVQTFYFSKKKTPYTPLKQGFLNNQTSGKVCNKLICQHIIDAKDKQAAGGYESLAYLCFVFMALFLFGLNCSAISTFFCKFGNSLF